MIFLILILGLILRLVNLNQSFWWDEAINVVYARDQGLIFYLTNYILGDFHPHGWFFVLWIFTHIFGFSEIVARLPAVIFGTLTIYFTYLIGKEHAKKLGLIAALLMAVAPLHIYYSQEARPYAFGTFAVAVSSYFYLKFIKGSGKRFFLPLILSTALVLYSDYPAYFIFLPQAFFLFINFREKLFFYLKILGVSSILFLPALPLLIKQLISGINTAQIVSGWAEIVGGRGIKDVMLLWVKMLIGRISIEDQLLYILVILLISLIYSFVLSRIRLKDLKSNFFFYWLITPPIFGIIISFFIPIFSYFRFLYILPAFYLLIAQGIEKFKGMGFKLMLGFLVTLQIILSLIYLLNPNFHREAWKEAVEFLDNQNSLVYFENNEIIAPYKFYSQKSSLAKAGLKKVPATSKKDLDINLENDNEVLLVEYLIDVTDPNRLIHKRLAELGFVKIRSFDFRGVGFIHLYRK